MKKTRQLKQVPARYNETSMKHDVYPCPRTAAERLCNLIAALEHNEARSIPEGGTPGQRFAAFKKQAFSLLAGARYEATREKLLESFRVPGEGA